ncbi:MAG TPA: indole-3-glycerol phosphate synthase TrpC [Acidimicrobiia bacterium]|nr:indole-3-glycerol phosphate synthase TrpC [Acidimicrobiia bacterium]
MAILDEILAVKRDEVTVLHQPKTRDRIQKAALNAAPPRDFTAALRRSDGRLAVISEIKRRSPSKGDLAPDLDPAALAARYESGGAAALSVLTDGPFFGGAVSDLQAAHEATALPALRKDFVIDEVQVYETRGIGADAMLLIVAAIPDDGLLSDLHSLARLLDLAVLVEAHDAAEVERAVACGAGIVGVNSRSLQTFAEDLAVGEGLASMLPPEVVRVAESAVRSVDDAARMAAAGFDAVLVGEAFVRADDPETLLRKMSEVVVAQSRRSS